MFVALFALMVLNIALIGFKIGPMPVRAAFAVALLGFLTLQYPAAFRDAFERVGSVMGLAVVFATVGTFVSLINKASLAVILGSIIEVHLQIAVTVLLATMIASLCGARPTLLVIAAAVGLSALVALVQFLGAGWAWSIRDTLGRLQEQDMTEVKYFLKGRPMGLSFSPIHLATQLCLAFAAITITRMPQPATVKTSNSLDIVVLLAIVLLVGGSVIGGNRSPILGAGIFFMFYASRRGGSMLPVLLAGLALLAYLLTPLIVETLQSTNLRVAQSSDRSAASRLPLATLGFKLFLENPLGYGFGFDPSAHWTKFWHEIYTLPNAEVIRDKALHNYPLSMLNVYGVGLAIPLVFALVMLARARSYLIYFIPYLIHIMFHNSGPFWNDTVIWFVIGAASAMHVNQPLAHANSYRKQPTMAHGRKQRGLGRGGPVRTLLNRSA